MIKINEGDKAPDFSGKDQNGKPIAPKDFIGKKVVLYFYPKDSTPGCTQEACNLRDNYHAFLNNGYAVIGVSADNEKSHQNFINKYNLPFPLISDVDKTIIKAFSVWGRKKFMGREFDGILRTTFIIDENGIVEKIISKVDTKNHTSQIIE
jgi:thioredoxin-dependent peroxiredoxin